MKVVEIEIERLEDHPQNPRRELGDLKELAASIKETGIKQNLTVVPSPEHSFMYRVIIGHRRFHAAVIAGLETVPCTIEQMDEGEQLATMMAENDQRRDLTMSDEVFGVQCMLDLGLDGDAIAKKTGLSKDYVGKRIRASKAGYKDIVKAEAHGATIADMIKLGDLEDEADRARAFEMVEQSNYSSLGLAIDAIKRTKRDKEIMNRAVEALRELDNVKEGHDLRCNEWVYIRRINPTWVSNAGMDIKNEIKGILPQDGAKVLFITDNSGTCIDIYRRREADTSKEEADKAEENRKREIRRTKIQEADKLYKEKRRDWLRNTFNGDPRLTDSIVGFFRTAVVERKCGYCYRQDAEEFDGLYGKHSRENALLAMAIHAYLYIEAMANLYNGWRTEWEENRAAKLIIETFAEWGYPLDAAEEDFVNGKGEIWQ